VHEGSAGFWSYAREDDERDAGRIRGLADAVRNEYSLLTGRDLSLFIDRDLQWGEVWRERIDEALSATTFFIPVITPRYFTREECRRELLTFAGHAKSLGREDLVMPIYWVDVVALENKDFQGDEALELVSAMERADWRQVRLESVDSSAYRTEVSALAARLAEIAAATVDVASPASAEQEAAEQTEPGVLELVADADEAFPIFNEALEKMGAELEAVMKVAEKWTPTISRASQRGAGATLMALKEMAVELDAPANNIEDRGRTYSSQLVRIDPAVLRLIRQAELGLWDETEARELFASLRETAQNGAQAAAVLTDLLQTLREVGSLSRDIRRPLEKIRDGTKNVLDGQAVLDEWKRRADQVEPLLGAEDEDKDDRDSPVV
jgi:hypothetical protein